MAVFDLRRIYRPLEVSLFPSLTPPARIRVGLSQMRRPLPFEVGHVLLLKA
jgi:hypothetical protein